MWKEGKMMGNKEEETRVDEISKQLYHVWDEDKKMLQFR